MNEWLKEWATSFHPPVYSLTIFRAQTLCACLPLSNLDMILLSFPSFFLLLTWVEYHTPILQNNFQS